MVVSIILGIIWALLMWRSVVCEYRYYAAVKLLEPDVWHQLGSPSWIKAPMVFVSPRGAQLLDGISHETVRGLAGQHRKSGRAFLAYTIAVLAGSIAYFRFSG